jgi:hypothetical protein
MVQGRISHEVAQMENHPEASRRTWSQEWRRMEGSGIEERRMKERLIK